MFDLHSVDTYLVSVIRSGTLKTYSESFRHFGLPDISLGHKWQDSELFRLFGQIDRQDIAARRPMRTSVIVRKTKGRGAPVPGVGYFTVLCNSRGMPVPRAIAERRRIHAIELALLREYYGVGLPIALDD